MKKYLIELYKFYKFTTYFFEKYKPIGINKLIFCYTKGFFPSNYVLFRLDVNDYQLYISDFKENFKVSRINKKASILNNKIFFGQLITSIIKSPEVLCFIYQGKVLPFGNSNFISFDNLIEYLIKENSFILKPIDDDGGVGVVKVEYYNSNFYWNSSEFSLEQLRSNILKLDNYFVSETLKQNEYSDKLYSHSVNTVRLLTMINPSTNIPFIAACAHRIGNDISKPVDNCAKGGYTASIDVDFGIIGKAVNTKFKGTQPKYFSTHPDSGSPIEGVTVPYFEELKKQALELHERLSFIEYIGWDFALSKDNKWVVIEGNDSADLKLHQVHEPLLKNPEVLEFYRYHRVI
jgi:hypothetical protein